MENLLPILIQIASGAVGGNAAGTALKNQSLGRVGDTITGALGGGLGGLITGMMGAGAGVDAGAAAGFGESAAGGGIGGIVVMLLVAIIKNRFMKQ